jgi:hypothetical protein
MPDPREPYGRIVHEIRLAFNAELAHPRGVLPWEQREAGQQEMDMRIGEAVAAAARERYETREAEIRNVITGFFAHHGNSTAAYLQSARDLAEGITQVMDRDKISSEEESP